MRHAAKTIDQMLIYWLAIAMAAAVLIAPRPAISGGYVSGGSGYNGPRWSNDFQLQQGLVVQPGCVTIAPGASAEYIPGRDAYGRPVPPADSPSYFGNALPNVDLDIKLGKKHIGGKTVKLYADGYAYDPVTDQFTLHGQPMQRDCLPLPK
ncbi:MAG: hypothetical protein MPJ78_03950 [Hyphomicrobiaceae bacterium]|nr:hypothetical protein [Hyphomicrobiaceae bacterium]